MQQRISLKNNLINFDINSLNFDIEDILKNRFKDNELEKNMDDLYDPYLFSDMKKAVLRIKEAYKKNEKVMIFWDYDVDWITSTSILMHFFKKVWIQASYRLPHRVKDGYWMKKYFIDEIYNLWVKLIITVDCWTRDIEVIKYAKSKNIDIIITDHHAVPDVIPKEAVAIINPKRKDCNYPFKELAWAWVAFKLMSALASEFMNKNDYINYLKESTDIAAIWTVADCMPLIWENRIIVLEGLKQIKKSRSKWLKKLIQEKISQDLDADIFAFLIWPRLNAAWRLDTPYKAINLILNNWDKIDSIINEIENINNKRKELTKIFTNDALSKINPKNNIIFYDSKEIEHWIIWIVAWKIAEEYNKPCIVLKDEWDKLIASCRSPEFFSIIEYLEKYKDYFLHFWWHKQAAWFTISKEKLESFRMNITSEINKIDFSQYKKQINVDKIISPYDIWINLYNKVNSFKPFWIWNKKPIFMFYEFEFLWIEFLWKTKEHISIKNKYWIKIIWFNIWDLYEKLSKKNTLNIIFEISNNVWMWKDNIQCMIIDVF